VLFYDAARPFSPLFPTVHPTRSMAAIRDPGPLDAPPSFTLSAADNFHKPA